MRDPIRQAGDIGLGARLRRLSERLDEQAEALYRARGIAFAPPSQGLMSALSHRDTASLTELAAELGVSLSSLRRQRAELIREGLIRAGTDRSDPRRQLLALTPKGRRVAAKLAPLWTGIAAAVDDVLAVNAPHLLADLGRVEAALDGMAIVERVAEKL